MSDKFLCYLATLIAMCYISYIACFTILGLQPADGIVFSAVIGAIALMGGIKIQERFPGNGE